ncbi:Uncharacterised protein [Vibrio cholerae]|nr:Uncharacterised protein [Vibrio cholerae]
MRKIPTSACASVDFASLMKCLRSISSAASRGKRAASSMVTTDVIGAG